MTALTEFLFPAPAPRTTGAILLWWERRRIPFNLIVGGAGLVSLTAVSLVSLLPPGAHGLGAIPVLPVLAFGVLANVFYLLGPTVEIAVHALWGREVLPTGPTLYRMGLTFSVGLALLPTLIVLIDWGFRILRAVT